jgi:hypothetical protein
MLIVETSVFTRRVLKLLSDEKSRSLQQVLVADPEAGMSFLTAEDCGRSGGRSGAAENGAAFGSSITGLPLTKRF